MDEYWKPVKDFEKSYEISSYGKLRNINSNRICIPLDKGDRYVLSINHTKSKKFHIYDLYKISFSQNEYEYYTSIMNPCRVTSLEDEVWVNIENFEDYYQVSNKGRVKGCIRNTRTWKIRKEKIIIPGGTDLYQQIKLNKNGEKHYFLLHRVVAKAFIPNPNNYPQINHIDANSLNNRVENLEWCTPSYNIRYAYKIGNKDQRGEKNNASKITQEIANKIREIRNNDIMISQEDIGKIFGVSRQIVKNVLNLKTWNYQ